MILKIVLFGFVSLLIWSIFDLDAFFFIWVFFFFILEVEKLNLGGNWELGILMICLLL